NNYTYNGGYLYKSVFEDHAASGANGVRIEKLTLDGAAQIPYPFRMVEGAAKSSRPILLRNCIIQGGTKGAIENASSNVPKSLDVVQCELGGDIHFTPDAGKEEVIRVQPIKGQPYSITKAGRTTIPAFAPLVWGNGEGLKGVYYNGAAY